ncbi:hypothetical protein O1157_15960 [Streptomyces albogriseolus]
MQGFIYDLITNAAGSLVIVSVHYAARRVAIAWRANRRRRGDGGATDSNF